LYGRGSGSRPVSRVLSWTAIHLGRWSPIASCSLPADSAGRLNVCLFGLAPDGVCPPRPLPARPCALTARFHPCLCPSPCGDWPCADAHDPFPWRIWLSPHPLKGRTLPLARQSPGHRRYVSVALSVALGRGLASPAYSAQALPGILPCGARTFLRAVARAAAVWPTPGRQYRGRPCLKRTELRTPPTHPPIWMGAGKRSCAWRARARAGRRARRTPGASVGSGRRCGRRRRPA
jgi:hypothetical protein